MAYDLFVSYRRKDSRLVRQFVDLLRKSHKLQVWLDQTDIEDFESSTQSIANGIAQSRALLAWYSASYPESRPCQTEFAAGFLAASRGGDPRRRVLIVNPEPGNEHIHPVEMRDQNYLNVLDDTPEGLERAAAVVAGKVSSLEPTLLGEMQSLVRPSWYGRSAAGSSRFTGRLPELFAVHSALQGASYPIVARERVPIVQVRGLGGLGKSLLAEEYAIRFGRAFPAGVFWLQAVGVDDGGELLPRPQRNASREQQFRAFARELGANAEELEDAEAVRGALRRQLEKLSDTHTGSTFLWVVDDLPTGVKRDEMDTWTAPHPGGCTLITARSREHDAYGTVIDLKSLQDDEALTLLTLNHPPDSQEEHVAAREVANQLGFLPLALEVAGAAIRLDGSPAPYQRYLRRLGRPDKDALEVAARLAGELPTGHTGSVASTLLQSIQQLDEPARDFLRLAAQVARAPIPHRLVVAVFGMAFGLDPDDAEDRAIEAFRKCELLSLADRYGRQADAGYEVHALVARTLLIYYDSPHPHIELRQFIVQALLVVLPSVVDVRLHTRVEPYVIHARYLVSQSIPDSATGDLLGWVARFDHERGNYESAAALLERQVIDYVSRFGGQSEEAYLAKGHYARALAALGRANEALPLQKEILKGRRRLLGHRHIDTMTAMAQLAISLSLVGERVEALSLEKKVLAARRRVLGPKHEHTLFSLHNYGARLAELGHHLEARPYLEQAYELRRQLHGPDHVNTLASGEALGVTRFMLGDLKGAGEIAKEVAAMSQRALGDEHPQTLAVRSDLGRFMIAEGDVAGARELLERTLPAVKKKLGANHPVTLVLMNNLGKALLELGELALARPLLEQATIEQATRSGVKDGFAVRFALNLFELLLRQNDYVRASEVFADRLKWLLDSDPTELQADQREHRDRILGNPELERIKGMASRY